jgi:hypothetical protein
VHSYEVALCIHMRLRCAFTAIKKPDSVNFIFGDFRLGLRGSDSRDWRSGPWLRRVLERESDRGERKFSLKIRSEIPEEGGRPLGVACLWPPLMNVREAHFQWGGETTPEFESEPAALFIDGGHRRATPRGLRLRLKERRAA